ncbi:MAG: hypothetical protein WC285_02725 [Candidatus Gracilibacteria bacterium]
MLAKKTVELDRLTNKTDLNLQVLVDITLDEFDGFFEQIEEPKQAEKRIQFIRDFTAKFKGFELRKLIDLSDVENFRKGREGYYFYQIFVCIEKSYKYCLSKFEGGPSSRPNELVESLKALNGVLGYRRIAKVISDDLEIIFLKDAMNRRGNRDRQTELAQVIDACPKQAISVLNVLDMFSKKGVKIVDPIDFAKKMRIIAGDKPTDYRLDHLVMLARTQDEFLHLTGLYMEDPGLFNNANDLAILIEIGAIRVMDLTVSKLKELSSLNTFYFGDSGRFFRTSQYRKLLSVFSLKELCRAGKVLGWRLEDFMTFSVMAGQLLPGSDLFALAKRFKQANLSTGPEFKGFAHELLSLSKSWDEAFRVSAKIKRVSKDTKKKQDVIALVEEYPAITDQTLIGNKGLYHSLVETFIYHEKAGCFSVEGPDDLKNAAEAIAIFADVCVRPEKTSNTEENRKRLSDIHPILLQIYDRKRVETGLSAKIVPPIVKASPLAVPCLKIGQATPEVGIVEKARNRPAEYLVDRAVAGIFNENGVRLQMLGVPKIKEKNDIKYYEYYLDGEREIVRIVRMFDNKVAFNVYVSSDKSADNPKDTPMNKFGAIFEATGSMVEGDGKPTSLLIINGKGVNETIHPVHDGVLIIGKDGIPRIEHIESIDGRLLGLSGKIDGKYKDREKFAQKIAELKLTVMQASLFVNDGQVLPITTVGASWYKRAFVEFNDGSHGFVETRQAVDNKTFGQILVDAGIKDALLLDTGYYDRYRDVNGNVDMREERVLNGERQVQKNFSPILLYGVGR